MHECIWLFFYGCRWSCVCLRMRSLTLEAVTVVEDSMIMARMRYEISYNRCKYYRYCNGTILWQLMFPPCIIPVFLRRRIDKDGPDPSSSGICANDSKAIRQARSLWHPKYESPRATTRSRCCTILNRWNHSPCAQYFGFGIFNIANKREPTIPAVSGSAHHPFNSLKTIFTPRKSSIPSFEGNIVVLITPSSSFSNLILISGCKTVIKIDWWKNACTRPFLGISVCLTTSWGGVCPPVGYYWLVKHVLKHL